MITIARPGFTTDYSLITITGKCYEKRKLIVAKKKKKTLGSGVGGRVLFVGIKTVLLSYEVYMII